MPNPASGVESGNVTAWKSPTYFVSHLFFRGRKLQFITSGFFFLSLFSPFVIFIPMSTQKSKRSLGPAPLLYPEPALLIATYDAENKPNFMTAAWAGICASDPVSLMVAIQPPRHTHAAILARKGFTVCVPSEKQAAETDFAGLVSGKKYDKFAACGFTAIKAEHVDAPYIAECPVILECSLTQHTKLGSHTIMIAEIKDVKADEDCLDETGRFPDVEKVLPIIFDCGSKNYYGIGKKLGKGWSIGKSILNK